MHTLVFGKRSVSAFNCRSQCLFRTPRAIARQHYREWLGIAPALVGNHDAIAYARLFAERRFQILRINIQSGGRYNYVFLAALEPKIALGIELADIPRAQPIFAIAHSLPERSAFPIAARDVFAPHQNFPVFREPEFAPWENFSNRSLRGAKGMVQADERCCFRHAVPLHDRVTNTLEKSFRFGGKGRTTGNKRPELPTQFPVNSAKPPGTSQKLLAVCRVQ